MVTIEITGLDEVNKFLRIFPKKISKTMHIQNTLLMKKIRKSAKLRALKDTGATRESIRILPTQRRGRTTTYNIIADSRAAFYQEFGFKPHFAPISGSTKMAPGVYFVSKWKPFMAPAVKAQMKNYERRLDNALSVAIK